MSGKLRVAKDECPPSPLVSNPIVAEVRLLRDVGRDTFDSRRLRCEELSSST